MPGSVLSAFTGISYPGSGPPPLPQPQRANLGNSDRVQLTLQLRQHLSIFSILWRRQWHPTPVLLPGNSHGWRSLVGCSPWGREESDMTERLHFHFSLSCIGEGNGNPLQCSCLENPWDWGAWWAAVHGVAQSWTRLKRLSSSTTTKILTPGIPFCHTLPRKCSNPVRTRATITEWAD